MEEHPHDNPSRRRRNPPPVHRAIVLDVNLMSDTELKRFGTFTPDEEFFTPTAATATATAAAAQSIEPSIIEEQSVYSKIEYQPHTLKSYNKARQTILPIFPPRSTLIARSKQPITTTTTTKSVSTTHAQVNINEQVDFLLCNVPKQLLTLEQYRCRQMYVYIPPFELRTWDQIKKEKNYHSYMLTFHNQMYVKLSKQWHIDIPILDFNLGRLRQIEIKHGFQFSFNDLPIALEFFLQTDVDLFYLKTCSFRQAQPRIIVDENGQRLFEGIFAIDQKSIEGRYGLTPCKQSNCYCCKKPSTHVQFIPKQIHSFLNQYKAILNCPVTCTSSNVIYALTCPCGEKDYVAHTNFSFVDCLLYHRQEVVRMIYEFLIGNSNVDLIELKPKSDETKANDEKWLYRHSVRCRIVMQMFLDRNPTYWCFVPVPKDPTLRARIYAPPQTLSTSEQIITTTTTTNLPIVRRSDTLAIRLANNVPKPARDYYFSHEQFNQQKSYFIYGRDRDRINIHNLHFYNATIVAVLPDHSSEMVKKFVQSLFITHAECQLNKDGRLITQCFLNDFSSRDQWYRGLIRPSASISITSS